MPFANNTMLCYIIKVTTFVSRVTKLDRVSWVKREGPLLGQFDEVGLVVHIIHIGHPHTYQTETQRETPFCQTLRIEHFPSLAREGLFCMEGLFVGTGV